MNWTDYGGISEDWSSLGMGVVSGEGNEMGWLQEEASWEKLTRVRQAKRGNLDLRQWTPRRLEKRRRSNHRRNLEKFHEPTRAQHRELPQGNLQRRDQFGTDIGRITLQLWQRLVAHQY